MTKLIIKLFIPNSENVANPDTRRSYGILGGTVGIILNLVLFGLKLISGLLIGSIAVISDAFNNLSDLGSSLISIIGSKLSGKSADEEHPYGHGRAEYISALIISFLILMVGIELIKSSIDGIINPVKPASNALSLVILILSILAKLWLWHFNKFMGRRINSPILLAASKDSLNDSIATLAVVISAVAAQYIYLPIDGIAGLCVSLLIIRTGIDIAKNTIDNLLGTAPSADITQKIETIMTNTEIISGIHGLMIHDYGPDRTIASVHAEVPDNLTLVEVHRIIDEIEHQILEELSIDIVIHPDPVPMKEI